MPPIILETPPAIVENGRVHVGFFREPFRRVNLLDGPFIIESAPKTLRRLRLKEWVGFGVLHPELFGGIIIQNAGYAASGTIYLYDRATRRRYEWLIVDAPWHAALPETLWRGESRCGRGDREMTFAHSLDDGVHRIHARSTGGRGTPAVSVNLVARQDMRVVDPLVVSLPILSKHHTYTHKSPLRLEGRVAIGDRTYDFDPERDRGNLDEQKTFYPYRSRWHWGCFIARSVEGREIMLNVVDQMTPKSEPGEDALWVDGRLSLIAQPAFTADGSNGDYRVEDATGRVRLRFSAEGAKSERRNWGVVAIDYQQFYGGYSGTITDNDGRVHRVENAFGALERMAARF